MEDIELKTVNPHLRGGTLSPLVLPRVNDDPVNAFKRPAVIVAPGGAYLSNSDREAMPVAARFLAEGFQAFVLHYFTIAQGVAYPEELLELATAVDYVRKHAEEYHVNEDEIFVVGFSAGGHLVGDLAMEWSDLKRFGFEGDASVKAIGLGYPVINHRLGHELSHQKLLEGTDPSEFEAKADALDLDLHVNANCPPAFLFATAEDHCVPVQNVLSYASALAKEGIPFALHIFPKGEHGISVADYEVSPRKDYPVERKGIRDWPRECADFFRSYCVEPF
ncbi:MAG: alpha/beta hydrolase [Candidatus Enteromonas sp.]